VKLTNKHNIPQPLVNLAEKRHYTRGRSDISVTQIIDAPRIAVLRERHEGEVVEDVVDGLWALVGTMFHKIAEEGADAQHLAEQRLFKRIEGWSVSGGIDIQMLADGKVMIADWKFTSAWAVQNWEKNKWKDQLDTYAYLVRSVKGWDVVGAEVWAFVRNWSRHDAARDPDYPQAQVHRVTIPLRTPDEAEAYVHERVRAHQLADATYSLGEELPECSDEDRWARGGRWFAKKPANKRPSFWGADKAEVEKKVDGRDGYVIEQEPHEYIRCKDNFCGVAQFCTQWQKSNPNEKPPE